MVAPASLIPELEEVLQHGSVERRAELLRRITDLFLERAPRLNQAQVALFDDVMNSLIREIELRVLAELARRIAPVPNAPSGVVRTLAYNDDISVAGPVLRHARLDERDLLCIAETKSQDHLLALSKRDEIGEALSGILVIRGNRDVSRSLADNDRARLSEDAMSVLVNRAQDDGVLAEKIGLRADIPPHLFRQLLTQASEVVRERLLARAKPEMRAEIRCILSRVTDEVAVKVSSRTYAKALAAVRELREKGTLGETQIRDFAATGRYEETIAGLATICAVPVEVIDRLMSGERIDPILILARAAGFGWTTARALIDCRQGPGPSNGGREAARENFERLTMTTAQRVVRFWQVREGRGD
ncbi:MAG: DUF2336 domain-containing protein [Pseudolabrys sp.]|nr:DUF2336 domain-containing protein [Pseudolabrys sp.]